MRKGDCANVYVVVDEMQYWLVGTFVLLLSSLVLPALLAEALPCSGEGGGGGRGEGAVLFNISDFTYVP